MNLSQLTFSNFRNYRKKTTLFSPKTTLILGKNTAGKTNLLEGIYFLALGKSFRALRDPETISWEAEVGSIECKLKSDLNLKIILTKGFLNDKKVPFKKYLVNGVSKRLSDFIGNLRAVLFRPEDLELITDSPGTRRNYLDSILVQADKEYQRSLYAYEKGLRQRNRLLDFIRDGKATSTQLFFWDRLLIKNGNIVSAKRQELIDFLNRQIDIFADLEVYYDASQISVERLAKYKNEEIQAGATLVGPHRDDFSVSQKKNNILRNVHSYGSRGEQRLAVLSLKLCELDFIEAKTGERPILLLDDIFSELDKEHQDLVIANIFKQQTIITSTDSNSIKNFLDKVEVVKL